MAGVSRAAHSGASRSALVVAESRLEEDPRLKTIWAGYAFAKDFREERGHAFMLDDQNYTERQPAAKQPGACLHCHASIVGLTKSRRWRPDQRIREVQSDAVCRSAQTGHASGRVHRLPRSDDAAASRHATGIY